MAFGLTMALVLQGGGYDVVARQEVAMAVWVAIGLGFAFGVLPRGRPSSLAEVSLGALGALILFAAVALSWSDSDERTFEELARLAGYSGYLTLAYFSLSRYTARAAAGGLLAAALFVPLLSLTARLSPELLTDEAAELFATDRLSYPLGYWNALACWSAMAIAMGLTWSAHARATWTRALLLAAVPCAGLTAYLTYSRAGAAAVVLAVLAALAFSRNRWTAAVHATTAAIAIGMVIVVVRGEPEIARATGGEGAQAVILALLAGALLCAVVAVALRRLGGDQLRVPQETARVAVGLAAVIVLLVAATAGREPIERGWEEFQGEGTPARTADPAQRLGEFGSSRDEVWESALAAFRSQRGRGIGPGTFEFWWAREGDDVEFVRDAHSLYFETLAEFGVVGIALLLVVFGAGLALAVRARRRTARSHDAGAIAAMIAGFIVFALYAAVDWVWEVPALVVLGLAGLGVAGAASFDRWGSSRLPRGAMIAAPLVALAAFALQVPGLVSTERLRASADELRAGDLESALKLAEEAVDAQPYAASPYVQRALVLEARGAPERARADLEDAIDREPTNWRHRLLLARLAARTGDRATVRRQLAEARRLSPNSVFLSRFSELRRELDAALRRER